MYSIKSNSELSYFVSQRQLFSSCPSRREYPPPEMENISLREAVEMELCKIMKKSSPEGRLPPSASSQSCAVC